VSFVVALVWALVDSGLKGVVYDDFEVVVFILERDASWHAQVWVFVGRD
jgi:hypothetical protein